MDLVKAVTDDPVGFAKEYGNAYLAMLVVNAALKFGDVTIIRRILPANLVPWAEDVFEAGIKDAFIIMAARKA